MIHAASASRMIGTGSRPVSAMRPAKIEMYAAARRDRVRPPLDLGDGHERRDVEPARPDREAALQTIGDDARRCW